MHRSKQVESLGSSLLRYFLRPQLPQFQLLLYTDYYQQYTFYSMKTTHPRPPDCYEQESVNIPRNIVRRRMRNEAIARIDTVSPQTGELFYLRALLLHKPAYNFAEL